MPCINGSPTPFPSDIFLQKRNKYDRAPLWASPPRVLHNQTHMVIENLCLDGDPARPAHRLQGVDHQIDQYLIQLHRVAQNNRKGLTAIAHQFNALLGTSRIEKIQTVFNHFIEIDRFFFSGHLPGKNQKFLNNLPGVQ